MEDEKNRWLSGDFTAESADGTAQKNARALGRAQLLASLLSDAVTYEEIMETLSE